MKNRCYNLNDTRSYAWYGGRGIKVCERWLGPSGFHNFVADMGPKPTPGHSLERIDNDSNYEPSNCRWATKREQAMNTRRSIGVDVDEAARESGLHPDTIRRRHRAGLVGDDLLRKRHYSKNYKDVEHGSTTMYCGHGCRCSLCRRAMADYVAKRRKTRSELDKII